MEIKELYRCVDVRQTRQNIEPVFETFEIVRETRCFYIVCQRFGPWRMDERRVSKDPATTNAYARASKQEALQDFLWRRANAIWRAQLRLRKLTEPKRLMLNYPWENEVYGEVAGRFRRKVEFHYKLRGTIFP